MSDKRSILVTCGCLVLTVITVVPLGACLTLALFHRKGDGPAEKDVVYGKAGGQTLLLDVYRPKTGTENGAGVILIHGGGWEGGDKADNRVFAVHLARAGFAGFSINYRLTTKTGNRYPAQLDDVQRAVRWVRANAGRFGIAADKLGAFGHSAGGHLAALLGTCDTRDNADPDLADQSSRVNCVVDTCGPTDFTDKDHPPVGPTLAYLIPKLLGKTLEEAPEAYRDASPVAHVSAKSVPFLIIHGTDDDLVPIGQSERLHAKLKQAGVESTLLRIENDGHLFQKPANQARWIEETVAFFRRHLTRP